MGVGNSASALACYMSHLGHQPLLFVRCQTRAVHLNALGQIRATGELEGEFPIEATVCPEKLCAECDLIFVATQANSYLEVAERLQSFLQPRHRLILFSSKFAGSREVSHFLEQRGVEGVSVLETDALFACRCESLGEVWIRGIKKWTLYSAGSRSATDQHRGLLESFFPGLEPAQNLVQRGLTDFGALAHPLTVLVNMNEIDRRRSFLFYYEGYTDKTVALLERAELEFQEVAAAYHTSLVPVTELLHRYYGCDRSSLLNAMRSVPNYRFSQSPDRVDTRYLLEDVPCTLVPVRHLARLAGIATPILDAIVAMATVLTGQDFEKEGRTLTRLGWQDFDHSAILKAISS